jgi:hypothetical protein
MRTAIKHTTPRQYSALQETPERAHDMPSVARQHSTLQDTLQQSQAMQSALQQPPAQQDAQAQATLKPQSQHQLEASPLYLTPGSIDGWETTTSGTSPVETTPPLTPLPSITEQSAYIPYDPTSDIQDLCWIADPQIAGVQDFDFSFDFLDCDIAL